MTSKDGSSRAAFALLATGSSKHAGLPRLLRILAAALVLVPSAASAAECFVSGSGTRLERTPAGVTVTYQDGSSFFCSTYDIGAADGVQEYLCEKLFQDLDITGAIFPIASTKGGKKDLLVFLNGVWYPQCK